MSDFLTSFESERSTHVANYSGAFTPGASYQKFDFVYNTGDGMYYYARENLVLGGGDTISDSDRFSFVPGGPYTSEGPSYYIFDSENQSDFYVGQILDIQGSQYNDNGLYKVLGVEIDLSWEIDQVTLVGSAINIIGLNDNEITTFELKSSNVVTLSEIRESPSESEGLWSKDLFFFDADYGSTVSFKTNNQKYQYGNGYYIVQPRNINSLTFEVDLKFKNRTNREANAIVHFVENHQGQHTQHAPSNFLNYSVGMSGFNWAGSSSFYPYDHTSIQSKTFYCTEWNHSMEFEENNNIDVKIRNLDTSILQKENGLFVAPADEYSDLLHYQKNDVVYDANNGNHYYWSGDVSVAGKKPSEESDSWNREDGYYKDINTDYWTRDFFWKPSIGLNVSQKPRLNSMSVAGSYTQLYSDGINESLLNLDLQFNNRTDDEAYAILHFLEQHLGYLPFGFKPPSPYDKFKNFICQEWSHTYNYKNNHSISAKFEQYPFVHKASEYQNSISPGLATYAELTLKDIVEIKSKGIGEDISLNTPVRGRVIVQNIGGRELTLFTALILSEDGSRFKILGQDHDSNDVPAVPLIVNPQHYQYTLPPHSESEGIVLTNQFLDLSEKTIKLRKGYTEGVEGGYMFDVIGDSGGDTYVQHNNGLIRSLSDPSSYLRTDYFINEIFIENNKINTLQPGQQAYIEVMMLGLKAEDYVFYLSDESRNRISFINEDNNTDGNLFLKFGSKYYESVLYISTSEENRSSVIRAYLDL